MPDRYSAKVDCTILHNRAARQDVNPTNHHKKGGLHPGRQHAFIDLEGMLRLSALVACTDHGVIGAYLSLDALCEYGGCWAREMESMKAE
eukprot:scaffold23314_cov19-Tisochrysis_lutea.AAC.1